MAQVLFSPEMIASLIAIAVLYLGLTAGGVFLILRNKRTFLRAIAWGALLAVPSRIFASLIGSLIANLQGAAVPYISELIACAILGAGIGAIVYGAMAATSAVARFFPSEIRDRPGDDQIPEPVPEEKGAD